MAGYGAIDLATGVDAQSLNLAPRVGFAYRLGDKSVIRGGYGISYWTGRFGFTGGTLSTQFPVIYNIQNGNTGDYIVDGTFGSLPPVQNIPIPDNGIINPAPNQAFFVIPQHNSTPQVQNYNLTYQRELSGGLVFDIGYVGSLGRQLPFNQSLNAAVPGAGSAGLPFFVQFGRTAAVSLRANGISSNYNSLQTNLSKRFTNGYSFTVAYAYSKSLDVGSNQPGFTDNLDRRRQYGPSDFDQTHLLTISHLFELPFGKAKPYLNQRRGRSAAGRLAIERDLPSCHRHSIHSQCRCHCVQLSRQRQLCRCCGIARDTGRRGAGAVLVHHIGVCRARPEPVWQCGPQHPARAASEQLRLFAVPQFRDRRALQVGISG